MKHGVLSNCLHCGKINCKEEGYGPCLFCGNELIFDDLDKIAFDKTDEEIASLQKAVEKAKKLVQFDRESQKRTKVFDESTDWYLEAQNPWLSQSAREQAKKQEKIFRKQRELEKRKIHLTVDFFGRTIVESSDGKQLESDNASKLEQFIDVDSKLLLDSTDLLGRNNKQIDYEKVHGASVPALVGPAKDLYESLQKSLRDNARNNNKNPSTSSSAGGPQYSDELKDIVVKSSSPGGPAATGSKSRGQEQQGGSSSSTAAYRPRYEDREFDDALNQAALFGDKNSNHQDRNDNPAGSREEDVDQQDNPGSRNGTKAQQDFPAPKPLFPDALDEGKCLSLHQPWASLIVAGFKRAEGRGWNSDGKNKHFNRGRLWIHAAMKDVEDETVSQMEDYYKNLYGNYPKLPLFPSESGLGYPSGCILGCVDLVSIEDNESYKVRRKQELLGIRKVKMNDQSSSGANYADGGEQEPGSAGTAGDNLDDAEDIHLEENSSDYIFWLETPRKLAVPCKMSGDHKFWDIPRDTLKTLQKALLPVKWPAQGLPQQFEARHDLRFDLKTGGIYREERPASSGADHAVKKAENNSASKAAATTTSAENKSDQKLYQNLLDHHSESTASKLERNNNKIFKANFTASARLAESFIHLHDLIPINEQQQIIDYLAAKSDACNAQRNNGGFFVEQVSNVSTTACSSSSKTTTTTSTDKQAQQHQADTTTSDINKKFLKTKTAKVCRMSLGISNAKMSGSGKMRDLSCSFSMTHEVRNAGPSMTDSARSLSCLSCMRNSLPTWSKLDTFW